MDWLKDKPGLQLLLSSLITTLGLIFMYYLARGDNREDTALQDIETLKIEKASIPYVDQKYKDHFQYDLMQDQAINNKADKSLVESMDKKLDLILRKLD